MATINILGDIGASVQAEDIITQIQAAKGDKIKVLIASPGGSAFQGLMIHDALKASGKEVTTIALGLGASAAFIIFLAGDKDKREMGDSSLLMGHNSRTELAGTAAQIRDDLEAMDAIDDRMKAAVMAASGMSDEAATKLLSKDTFMNLETAMDLGLASGSIKDDIAASLNMNKTKKEPVKMATKEETRKAGFFAHMAAYFKSEHEDSPQSGPKLVSLLNGAIESKVSDEVSRADLISQIASASSIDESTVNGIVSGDIDCPPEERLSGFTQVLDISMDSIMAAWGADGCKASQDEDAKADHEDEDKEEAKAGIHDDDEEAKADHDDDEKKEMKAKIESLEAQLAETKAKAEGDEEEKKEEEAKASLILEGITLKKVTMHQATNLFKKSLTDVTSHLDDLSANATGCAKTQEPNVDASSKLDQWKAMKEEKNHGAAQKFYNKNSTEIRSEMNKEK